MERSTGHIEATDSSDLDFEKRLVFSFHYLLSKDNSLKLKNCINSVRWEKISKIVKSPVMECKNKWFFLIQKFLSLSRMEAKYGYDELCSQWGHYKLFKKMEPKMIQSYTQLFEAIDTKTSQFSEQHSEVLKQIELRRHELMKRTTSCTRRQELWTDVANSLNQKFPKEKMCILEWQAVWWKLKQELREFLRTEGIDLDRLSTDHRRVLKICGINSISDADAIAKLDSNYEFDENVTDLVCKKCSSESSELEDDLCKKCSQTNSTPCDMCSKASSICSLSTTTWNARAKNLLPKTCREKIQVSMCFYCHSRLNERASLLWKTCRVCAKENQQLENLMSSSYTDERQILQTAIGCTIRLSDGLPCFVCIKCRDDLLDFVRFYLTFSSSQDKLRKIHETTLFGQEPPSVKEDSNVATKRSSSMPQRSSKRLRLQTEKNNSFVAMGTNIKAEPNECCAADVKKNENILDEELESQLEEDIKFHLEAIYISSEEEELKADAECSLTMPESEVSDRGDRSKRLKSSSCKTKDFTESKSRERTRNSPKTCISPSKRETRGRRSKTGNNSVSLEETDVKTSECQPEEASKSEKSTNCTSLVENYSEQGRITRARKPLKTQMEPFISGWTRLDSDVEKLDCPISDDTPSKSTSNQCNSSETKIGMSHPKRLQNSSSPVVDPKRLDCSKRSMKESEESSQSNGPTHKSPVLEATTLPEREMSGRTSKNRNNSVSLEKSGSQPAAVSKNEKSTNCALLGEKHSEQVRITRRRKTLKTQMKPFVSDWTVEDVKNVDCSISDDNPSMSTSKQSNSNERKIEKSHSQRLDDSSSAVVNGNRSVYNITSSKEPEESSQGKGPIRKSPALEATTLPERELPARKCKNKSVSLEKTDPQTQTTIPERESRRKKCDNRNNSVNLEKNDVGTCTSQSETASNSSSSENHHLEVKNPTRTCGLSRRRRTLNTNLKPGIAEWIVENVENLDCPISDDAPPMSTSRQCNSNETKKEMSHSKRLKGSSSPVVDPNRSECSITSMGVSKESSQGKDPVRKSPVLKTMNLTERGMPEGKGKNNSVSLEKTDPQTDTSLQERVRRFRICKKRSNSLSLEKNDAAEKALNSSSSSSENSHLEVRTPARTYGLPHRRKTLNTNLKPFITEWIVEDVENVEDNPSIPLPTVKEYVSTKTNTEMSQSYARISGTEYNDSEITTVPSSVPLFHDIASASSASKIDKSSLSASKTQQVQQTSKLCQDLEITTVPSSVPLSHDTASASSASKIDNSSLSTSKTQQTSKLSKDLEITTVPSSVPLSHDTASASSISKIDNSSLSTSKTQQTSKLSNDLEITTVPPLHSSVPYSNDAVPAFTITKLNKNCVSTSKMEQLQRTSKLETVFIPFSTANNSPSNTIPNQRGTESTSITFSSQEKLASDTKLCESIRQKLEKKRTPSITLVKKKTEKISNKNIPTLQPSKQQIVDLKFSISRKTYEKQQFNETTNKILRDLLKRPALEVRSSMASLPLSVRTATTPMPEKINIIPEISQNITVSKAVVTLDQPVNPSPSKSNHVSVAHKNRCVSKTPTKLNSPQNTIEIFESDDDTPQGSRRKCSQEIDIIPIRGDSPAREPSLFTGALEANIGLPLRTDIALRKTLLPDDDDDDDSVIEGVRMSQGHLANMGQLQQSSLIDRIVERSFRIEPAFLQIKEVYSMNGNVNSTG